jgi:threonylcarbamoyladenosine tRNA methylthiotransferase MtaB
VERVFVQSFGCRASQADGAALEASFRQRGVEPLRNPDGADLLVVNTCTVTHSADVDARRTIRNLHRDYPNAKILVTGCYAQRAPEELVGIEGVEWVVGNADKPEIAPLVLSDREAYHGGVVVSSFDRNAAFFASPVRDIREDRTRPNLKVQDGCSNRCSFCIIPSVRGRSRSAPAESVLEQVRDLAARYCEVVLTGINLGRWGRDLPGELRFVHLLQRLLGETSVRRLRISSVEPMDWSESLLRLVADESRIADHVHLPLQSGSDAVLKRMFRKYRTRHYARRVELAGKLMPDAAIGADVMTGFPGETDAEFEETVRFLERQPFTYLHVFTYSERPGTAAMSQGRPVPSAVRRERTQVLRQLSDRKNLEFRQRMVGKTLSVVTLEERGVALSSNFLRVAISHGRAPNQIIPVTVGSATHGGLEEGKPFRILNA